MYPVLIHIGAFSLRTLVVFQVLYFLATGFVLWRKSREEHYNEMEIFDSYLFSFIFALFFSRLVYIFLNFSEFGFEILKWFNFVSHPGSNNLAFLFAAGFYLYRYAIKKKWDAFEIIDFWVHAISLGLFFTYLGRLFDGSMFGKATNMPWGIIFPGVFEKRHPVQLYFAIFYLLLYVLLNWFENNYRTFEWYRAGKKAAQTGFLVAMFLIINAVFLFIMTFFKMPEIVVNGVTLDLWIYLFFLFFGFILLVKRSGKSIFPKKESKKLWKVQQKQQK